MPRNISQACAGKFLPDGIAPVEIVDAYGLCLCTSRWRADKTVPVGSRTALVRGFQNSACELQNSTCGLQNSACGLWNSACGLQNRACGLQNSACGFRPTVVGSHPQYRFQNYANEEILRRSGVIVESKPYQRQLEAGTK